MGIFDRIFGKRTEAESQPNTPIEDDSKNLAVDELFLHEFKKNGGKFLYCSDPAEAEQFLQEIIKENQWEDQKFICLDPVIEKRYADYIECTSILEDSQIFITRCEHLIADQGSVLVCSKQLKGIKTEELPEHLIVYAGTSQIVHSLAEALKSIKQRHQGQALPTKITSFKNNEVTQQNKDDFMHYGTKTKNLYLLLVEDF
jgi:L-lactate utilization protein LutC